MLLDDKPFEQLTAADIQALIPAVSEGRRIDYKRELPDDREKSIRSLLNDVCAFANSAGGYLVYGVEEEQDEDGNNTGVPFRVCGIGNVTFDQVQLAWEQRIKQNIEPATNNRSVLGTLNDYTNMLQWTMPNRPNDTLIDTALWLADTPVRPIDGFPDKVARGLFGVGKPRLRVIRGGVPTP